MAERLLYTYMDFVAYDLIDVNAICNDDLVVHYAYIMHQPEGDTKQLHYHVVVKLSKQQTCDYFFNRKNFNQNVRVKGLKKRLGAFRAFEYLVHKNDPDKIQYQLSDVVSDDLSFWQSLVASKPDNGEFVVDLANLSPLEMALKYGRDYIKNYSKYADFKRLFLSDKVRGVDDDVDPTLVPPPLCDRPFTDKN